MNQSASVDSLKSNIQNTGREKKNPSEEENVVEEVEKKGVRARKFSSASTWCLVCEFLRPRLQRSEAKKAQGDTHPNRDREKRQKSRVSTAGVTQRKALQRDEGAGISAAGGEGGGGARSNSDNTCQRSSPMPGHARVRRPSGGRLPPLPISATLNIYSAISRR